VQVRQQQQHQLQQQQELLQQQHPMSASPPLLDMRLEDPQPGGTEGRPVPGLPWAGAGQPAGPHHGGRPVLDLNTAHVASRQPAAAAAASAAGPPPEGQVFYDFTAAAASAAAAAAAEVIRQRQPQPHAYPAGPAGGEPGALLTPPCPDRYPPYHLSGAGARQPPLHMAPADPAATPSLSDASLDALGRYQSSGTMATLSIKMYNCLPHQLPAGLRGELLWALGGGLLTEAFIRRGCLHLTFDVLSAKGAGAGRGCCCCVRAAAAAGAARCVCPPCLVSGPAGGVWPPPPCCCCCWGPYRCCCCRRCC
jgi:hypothetical protein